MTRESNPGSDAGPALTHLDASGQARMVDVSDKPITPRTATATGVVTLPPEAFRLVAEAKIPKGDVLGVARLAGIQAAKRTGELIPLCHPIGLDAVDVSIALVPPDSVRIKAMARVSARTGVEMEAMTAVAVAALAVYDMCKSVDKGITIGPIALESKTGGKSGSYHRAGESGRP